MEERAYYTNEDIQKAKEKGIPVATFKRRIDAYGYSIEKALNTPVRKRNTHNKEMMQRAEERGISNEAYRSRITNGYTEEEAATIPPFTRSDAGRKGREKIRKFTDEQLKIMESNGIAPGTARQRVNAYGMTIEEAITRPLNTKRMRQA